MIQAIEIIGAGGVTKIYRPTGVTGERELELQTARGPEPGGHWTSHEVANAVVGDILDQAA